MNNFIEINNLIELELFNELTILLSKNVISWDPATGNQICITTNKNNIDDCHYGCGSFIYDWSKKSINSTGKLSAPEFKNPKKEEEFTELCSKFRNTLFEKVYNDIKKHYNIGRIRIMNLKPKTCLTWHYDETPRLHYPIKTQDGCFMVVEDEVKHLSLNKWCMVDTTSRHSVFNGSTEDRIHLVATILNQSN